MSIAVNRTRAHLHAGRAAFANAGRLASRVIARDQVDQVVTMPPTNVKALAGAFTVIGLALIGIAVYQIRAYNLRKRAAKTAAAAAIIEKNSFPEEKSSFDSSFGIEKPKTAYLHQEIPLTPATGRWVPQIPSAVALPSPSKPRSGKAKKAWEKNLAKFIAPSSPVTQPPVYVQEASDDQITRVMPPMPDMAPSPNRNVQPPTPMKKAVLETPPITPASGAMLSPRSASFGHNLTPSSAASFQSTKKEDKVFPRLMTVTTNFSPSMADELALAVGETVRIFEEYEDEWCLVQRVGRFDESKGVCPRFCISEKKD